LATAIAGNREKYGARDFNCHCQKKDASA